MAISNTILIVIIGRVRFACFN